MRTPRPGVAEFEIPFYLFVELMTGDTQIGGRRAVWQSEKRPCRAYAPARHLMQLLLRCTGSVETSDAQAEADPFDNWWRVCTSRRATGLSIPNDEGHKPNTARGPLMEAPRTKTDEAAP